MKEIEETNLAELFNVAKLQGENIVNEKIVLKRFSQLKCKKIKVGELDYSDIESDLTLDDLCNMVNEYASSINKIRTMDSHSPEFIHAYSKCRNG